MRVTSQVFLGIDGAATFASSALFVAQLGACLDASLGRAAIEDHVDVGIILKAFQEMPVQPLMLA